MSCTRTVTRRGHLPCRSRGSPGSRWSSPGTTPCSLTAGRGCWPVDCSGWSPVGPTSPWGPAATSSLRPPGSERAGRGWSSVAAPTLPAATATRDQLRAALGVGADETVVLTVARLAPQKNLGMLLDVAAAVPDEAGLTFLIAGDGPERSELERRIAAERLPVRLLGQRNDLGSLLGGGRPRTLDLDLGGPRAGRPGGIAGRSAAGGDPGRRSPRTGRRRGGAGVAR